MPILAHSLVRVVWPSSPVSMLSETSVEAIIAQGWPRAAVLRWAAATGQYTPHALGVSLTVRLN
jgi:hypothetical protein